MSNLERRGSYTPRRVREQRAYRFVVAGGVSTTLGVLGIVLTVAGVVSAALPAIALLVAVICFYMFRRTLTGRG